MRILFCVILMLGFTLHDFGLHAQDKEKGKREFSFSVGVLEASMQALPASEHMDFLNYFGINPGYVDEITVKLNYHFDFLSRMTADMTLIVMSDLVPDNYDVSVSYRLNQRLGLGVGSSLRKNYISGFESFQLQYLPGYYLVDENVRQFKSYDQSFYLTPRLLLGHNKGLQAILRLDAGLASFLKQEESFLHKKKFANERLVYNYKTKYAFQPYINPQIDIRINTFRMQKTRVGFLFQAGYYYSKRSMPYMRSVQIWTAENETSQVIKPPRHAYQRFEASIGIFLNEGTSVR